jgi:hypothetical protein
MMQYVKGSQPNNLQENIQGSTKLAYPSVWVGASEAVSKLVFPKIVEPADLE